jgi:hypothetical protein
VNIRFCRHVNPIAAIPHYEDGKRPPACNLPVISFYSKISSVKLLNILQQVSLSYGGGLVGGEFSVANKKKMSAVNNLKRLHQDNKLE